MAKRFLRQIGVTQYENSIGFRADEESRVSNYKNFAIRAIPKFPLFDMGIVKQDVLDYWNDKSYNLEVPSILGNCDLCFLKGHGAIIKILSVYPELADKWIADEHHGTYIKNWSYAKMLAASKMYTGDNDLTDLQPAYSCSCTSM